MRFVLLTSRPDSPYADTPTSYEYPSRYRRFFAPLESGDPMIAIIYEPGSGGRGRMSYVGWAALRGVPVRSPRSSPTGQPLWEVHYVDRVQEFPNPVPRDYLGSPVERWLRDMAPEHRNVQSSGASVRFLEEDEGRMILELGHAGHLGPVLRVSSAKWWRHPNEVRLSASIPVQVLCFRLIRASGRAPNRSASTREMSSKDPSLWCHRPSQGSVAASSTVARQRPSSAASDARTPIGFTRWQSHGPAGPCARPGGCARRRGRHLMRYPSAITPKSRSPVDWVWPSADSVTVTSSRSGWLGS